MRRFFRYLLLGLVLVTVFLVSALTSMRLGIHGRETAVPKLLGMTPSEAQRSAFTNGLSFEVENRFYSADVPEGRIMSQAPAPGAKVRRGWKIRVAESLGPQRVQIPSVVGQSERAAQINLAERGLEVGEVSTLHLPESAAGQIVGQSPPPNAEGIAVPKVNLLVAAPEDEKSAFYVMPDFVGQHFGDAKSAITLAGFKLGAITVTLQPGSPLADDKAAKLRAIATDVIVSQSPVAGQKISAQTAIDFGLLR